MLWVEFLELLEEYFGENVSNELKNTCINDLSIVDVNMAYSWVKSRFGKCLCSCNLDTINDLKKSAVHRVVLMQRYNPELEMGLVNQATIDYMNELDLTSTRW